MVSDTEQNLKELIYIFETANQNFLKKHRSLFEIKASERTLCGALMIELYEVIKCSNYAGYFVDVEYNRNRSAITQNRGKTIELPDRQIKPINCDLIVHSRGERLYQDNLIAVEMKKSTRTKKSKEADEDRLKALTKNSQNDDMHRDKEINLPKHVSGYRLGVYYEINFKKNTIQIKYYSEGESYCSREITID